MVAIAKACVGEPVLAYKASKATSLLGKRRAVISMSTILETMARQATRQRHQNISHSFRFDFAQTKNHSCGGGNGKSAHSGTLAVVCGFLRLFRVSISFSMPKKPLHPAPSRWPLTVCSPFVAARRDVDRKAATPTSRPTAQPPNRDDRIATNPFKDKLVKHTRKLNNNDWNGPFCPQGSAITRDQLCSCYSHTYKAKSEPKSEPVLVILLMSPEQDHC